MDEIESRTDSGFPVLVRLLCYYPAHRGSMWEPPADEEFEFEVLTRRGQPLTFIELSDDECRRFEKELLESNDPY